MKKTKKPVKPEAPTYNLSNMEFNAVKWEGQSLEALILVAQGLVNLTQLFKSQNLNIETLLQLGPETTGTFINSKFTTNSSSMDAITMEK